MGTAQGLIDVAASYIGMDEDDQDFVDLIDYYNDHTDGYDMRTWDEWCACFVSVCALKSNNEDATGTSVNCAVFRQIWRDKGIYRDADEVPEAGWLIDYDWDYDDVPDHIGIVADCDGETIHVIEGNLNEVCGERWIPVGWQFINCFAAPDYDGEEGKEDDLKYVYNYGGDCHRFYNASNGQHMYTLSDDEKADLIKAGWKHEGVAFTTRRGGSDAMYRMYNPYNGEHVWTPKFGEAESLQEAGWKYEGVPFFAWGPGEGGTEVHRLFNPFSGLHMMTADKKELDDLVRSGWKDEFSFAV